MMSEMRTKWGEPDIANYNIVIQAYDEAQRWKMFLIMRLLQEWN